MPNKAAKASIAVAWVVAATCAAYRKGQALDSPPADSSEAEKAK